MKRVPALARVAAVIVAVALLLTFAGWVRSWSPNPSGLSAEQTRHEVCLGLSANKAKGSTLADQAQAAAQQDADLTAFAQALKSWESGSMTAEQNHMITTTCRSEFKGPGS